MAKMTTPANAEMASIRAIVTRADGTVEDHGIVAYWHSKRHKRIAFRVRQIIKGRRN